MKKINKPMVIQGLKWMASYDYQKLAWFPNNENLLSSFLEIYQAVFEDSVLLDALEDGNVVFDKVADAALWDLHQATDAIDVDIMREDEILDSSAMQIIRNKAAFALDLVQKSTGKEKTVEYFYSKGN